MRTKNNKQNNLRIALQRAKAQAGAPAVHSCATMLPPHQPGDTLILGGIGCLREVPSGVVTGGEMCRAGFDLQVFLTFLTNGGV